MRIAAVGALVMVGLSGPGCVTPCTAVGAEEGLVIDVQVVGTLPPDAYVVVARSEGRELMVPFELTADGLRCVGTCSAVSDADGRAFHLWVTTMSAAGGEITTGFLGEAAHGAVTVELRSATRLLAAHTYEPRYLAQYPNGRRCDAEHPFYVDHDTLTVPAP